MQQVVYRFALRDESDVAAARRDTRKLAAGRGFSTGAVEALTTAVSEVARNVIVHAGHGQIRLGIADDDGRLGLVVITEDDGPGIQNIEDAMRDGHSTGDGLGLGLPSARRLVDEFELHSVVGQGTTVTLRMWLPRLR